MAILDYGVLQINGETIAYETGVKIKPGKIKRVPNPQINGDIVYTSDISENKSMITVTIRVTPENNELFDTFFDNGDNNTITFRDQNFTNCTLEEPPEREDQGTADYVFYGNPAI